MSGLEFTSDNLSRVKSWGEINSDEKIERLRHEVILLKTENRMIAKKLDKLVDAFIFHSHHQNGKPVTWIQSSDFSYSFSADNVTDREPNTSYI